VRSKQAKLVSCIPNSSSNPPDVLVAGFILDRPFCPPGYELRMFCEDDCELRANLGIDDAVKITDNLLKIKKGLTTTAQLFKRTSLEMVINIIESSDTEIDNTYNDLLEDKYCVYPMCVYQRESYSDINKNICDYGNFHRKYFY
jgi:hypothetical protein